MTQDPGYPAEETRADKRLVAGAQAAADAAFNAHARGEAPDVEGRLRQELADAGASDMPQEWVAAAAARIRAGDPVVVEPDES